MKSTRDTDYIHIGVQYYIAGRHSALCYLMPVTGNLFHHAFEMLFKAKLLSKFTPDELYKNYGHDLRLVWPDFISMTGAKSLKSFSKTIHSLQRWEDVRYPNFPGKKSVFMIIDMKKGDKSGPIGQTAKTSTQFRVNLEEIDELFKAVILNWPINPEFIKAYLAHGESSRTYGKDNHHMLW